MTRTISPSRIYDEIAGPGLDMSRWSHLEFPPGPDDSTGEPDGPAVRCVGEEIIPEFGVKPPGTSATSGFRVAVIRVIGGVAEEEAAIERFRRAKENTT